MERMETGHRNPLEEKPEFFKVLIGDFKHRLRIPPNFIKHISLELTERVILEGPSGDVWEVKLVKTKNGMFLEDGWETFLSDHTLRDGDFLIFKYNGHMHFSIRIFDQSACLREDTFIVKSSQESTGFRGKKRRGRPPKELATTRSSKAREAARTFSYDFPYFLMEMKASNVQGSCSLTIPACFEKSHLQSKKKKMKLQNGGKVWEVNCIYYPGRPVILCGGWRHFSSDNNLTIGDFCVFELVDEFDMKVHIYRYSEADADDNV